MTALATEAVELPASDEGAVSRIRRSLTRLDEEPAGLGAVASVLHRVLTDAEGILDTGEPLTGTDGDYYRRAAKALRRICPDSYDSILAALRDRA